MQDLLSSLFYPLVSQAATAPTGAPEAAATATSQAARGDWSPFVGIVLMLAVFFFFIILPQNRKAKKQAEFLAGLKKGDSVVTVSGFYGKIVGIADKVITLEIAPQVRVRVDRQTIAGRDENSSESKEKAA